MQRVIQSVLGGPSAGASRAPGPLGGRTSSRGNWQERYGIRHVAIIPDGNRRWAQEQSVPAMVGHSTGLLQVLPALVRGLSEAGVHTMTAWGFSTENWKRQSQEIDHLMAIFANFLENQMLALAGEYDARVVHLGRKDRMPPRVANLLESVERKTASHGSHVYNVALDYGGEDELHRAAVRMAKRLAEAGPDAANVSSSIRDYLDTADQPHPDPDILVRSSGENRMSGFMPLQTAYSELFFVNKHFPEFDMDLLEEVAESFLQRKRRFGK